MEPALILENEGLIRFSFFFGILILVAVAERLVPKRGRTAPTAGRWVSNLSIVAINAVLLRLMFPVLAVGMAWRAEDMGWGLFNHLAWPMWAEVLLAVIIFDFAIYLQHLIFHHVPILWRMHRMHHLDLDVDVTTGTRFHPLEILLSMLIKIGVVFLIGPAALAVIIFEIVLNGMAMFNHGNLRLPLGLDRILRKLIVTPDMHRVHHSIKPGEFNRNFGFNLSIWDRLIGTYRAQPSEGHRDMTIGQADWRDRRKLTLPWLLIFPFLKDADRVAGPAEAGRQ